MHRVPGAIARFDEAFAPTITAFLRHVDRSPVFADDVRQLLLDKLFVAEEAGALPKIAGYSGRGQLSSWVGVAAQRTGLSLVRGSTTARERSDDAVAEALPDDVDPELDYLRTRYRTEFREAFQAAFAALAQRERMVLRLCLVKRLSHEEIAAMYQVNQSTVTRWIAKARESIAAHAQQKLRERLNVRTEEFHSIGNLVASQLDLSITRWLGGD
jgi:RNA polymerase sigma-70 factor